VARRTEHPSADPIQRLFELSPDLHGTASTHGYFTRLNPAWERTLGWTSAELMAEPFISFVHPEDVAATIAQAARLAGPNAPTTLAFENRYRTRDGAYRSLQWTAVAEGEVLYFVARDVSDRKATEVARDQAASVSQGITDSVDDGLCVADPAGIVTFVNPAAVRALGYGSADELLGCPQHATFHHTRADGTAYPIEDCPLLKVRTTGQPVRVDEDVFWRKDGTSLPVSYSSAPIGLEDGTGCVLAFRDITGLIAERERVNKEARHVVWFERVRQALIEDRFVLYGQPIVDLATGRVAKHELLLRMVTRTGEIVAPGEFLPAAEKYGLIHDIDRWVITQAVELAATGRPVAANLSAESVGRLEVLLHIQRELFRTGASAENLTFELTETALMGDVKDGRRFGDRLVELGCSFSLDDFGTGYGALTYLRRLPVTDLKIDVQFVRDMANSESDQRLVQGIVHIAHSLGKATIAEGVEDERTLELLRDMGVDYAQGYHLGRPTPLVAGAGGPVRRGEGDRQPQPVLLPQLEHV